MTNFPYFNQFVIKLSLVEQTIDEALIDYLSQELIEKLRLNVVGTSKYIFDNGGMTKVFILSQSHLIVHTWPEDNAIHFDLMSCKRGLTIKMIDSTICEWGFEANVKEIE